MRMTVTGGAGFIGSHLVERLLAAGHDVVVLDNLTTGKLGNLPRAGARLRVIEGDVTDPEAAAAAVDGSDAVFHLAAVASVQASIDDPVATNRVNLLGTLAMLEATKREGAARAAGRERASRPGHDHAARPRGRRPIPDAGRAGLPFVFASSAAVYGDAPRLPTGEDSPARPLSPYAIDKLASEHYLAHYHRRGEVDGVTFRLFNVYGPRQDPSSPYSGVISIYLERAAAGEPLTVFGDGEQTRDFVFVSDVAEQLAGALDHPVEREPQTVNVGTGHATSLLELIAALETLAGPLDVRHEPERPGDVRHSLADIGRLRALCERSDTPLPGTSIGAGLRRLLSGDASP